MNQRGADSHAVVVSQVMTSTTNASRAESLVSRQGVYRSIDMQALTIFNEYTHIYAGLLDFSWIAMVFRGQRSCRPYVETLNELQL